MDNKFIIIIPTYNAEDWIERNIASVKEQTYQNYRAVIVNDLSEDRTPEIIMSSIQSQSCCGRTAPDPRFLVVLNPERSYPLGSTVHGINIAEPEDEDIIVVLDGDDWFFDGSVLHKLNVFYSDNPACLLTYRSYVGL